MTTAMQPATEMPEPKFFGKLDLAAIIRENLQDSGISRRDLDKLKMPGAGGTVWETPDGNADVISGVLVYHKDHRGYYSKPFDGDSVPPDCASEDMILGSVEFDADKGYGGECDKCPFGQWAVGAGGIKIKPKCAQRKRIYVLKQGKALPEWIDVPPTSLKVIREYMKTLTKAGKMYWQVVTNFALVKRETPPKPGQKKGIAYSELVITWDKEQTLNDGDIAMLYTYRPQFEAFLQREPEPSDDDDSAPAGAPANNGGDDSEY